MGQALKSPLRIPALDHGIAESVLNGRFPSDVVSTGIRCRCYRRVIEVPSREAERLLLQNFRTARVELIPAVQRLRTMLRTPRPVSRWTPSAKGSPGRGISWDGAIG